MTDRLKPYPCYKDPGVEWLGEVPEHWEMRRLGDSVLGCINGVWGADPNGADDLPCVRVADFDRQTRRVRDPIPTIRAVAPNERRRRILEPGDLLLEKSGGGVQQPVGVVILFDQRIQAVCSNFVARMPVRDEFDSGFLVFLHSTLYSIGLNSKSIKQTTGIQNLDSAAYLGEAVAFPPLLEQAAIVRYLDHVDRRVRRLVRAKRKLIALLTEQKQAIIQRAVTRGLDPDVPLKDSGVEWLGEVPEHWEVWRSKLLFSPRKDLARSDDIQLSATQAYGVIPQDEYEQRVGRKITRIFRHLEKRRHVEVGDFVISMRSFQGGLERAWARGCIRSSYTVLQHSSRVDVDFFSYVFKSRAYIGALQSTANFIRDGQDLTFENFCAVDLALPPREEQRAIAKALKAAVDGAVQAAERARREVALLNEFRTRLIADVVTGKLDVRVAAAALPEVDPLAVDDEANDIIDVDAASARDEPDTIPELSEA